MSKLEIRERFAVLPRRNNLSDQFALGERYCAYGESFSLDLNFFFFFQLIDIRPRIREFSSCQGTPYGNYHWSIVFPYIVVRQSVFEAVRSLHLLPISSFLHWQLCECSSCGGNSYLIYSILFATFSTRKNVYKLFQLCLKVVATEGVIENIEKIKCIPSFLQWITQSDMQHIDQTRFKKLFPHRKISSAIKFSASARLIAILIGNYTGITSLWRAKLSREHCPYVASNINRINKFYLNACSRWFCTLRSPFCLELQILSCRTARHIRQWCCRINLRIVLAQNRAIPAQRHVTPFHAFFVPLVSKSVIDPFK